MSASSGEAGAGGTGRCTDVAAGVEEPFLGEACPVALEVEHPRHQLDPLVQLLDATVHCAVPGRT